MPFILGTIASAAKNFLWTPEGAFDSLATVTVPSGGVSSITFAGIPNTYKHLQIRGFFRTSSSAENKIEMNGITTTTSYYRHYLQGSGAGVGAGANNSNSMAGYYETNTDIFGTHIIDILDYANTSKIKVVRTLWGFDANGSGYVGLSSGANNSTSAINSISLVPTAGSYTEYSQFALYGVK
jgi:hypothetical protein